MGDRFQPVSDTLSDENRPIDDGPTEERPRIGDGCKRERSSSLIILFARLITTESTQRSCRRSSLFEMTATWSTQAEVCGNETWRRNMVILLIKKFLYIASKECI